MDTIFFVSWIGGILFSILMAIVGFWIKEKELFNLSESINFLIMEERIKSIPKKSLLEEELKKVFNYDDKKLGATYQNNIKQFFERNLPTKTCYYCNLDFINSFMKLFASLLLNVKSFLFNSCNNESM